MEKFILVVHILAAAAVIGLVLLQHGKGADMGAAFGSGASGSLFGVSGSSNLLSKLTAIFISIFFATSLTLAYMASHHSGNGSVIQTQAEKAAPKKVELKSEPAQPVSKDVPAKDVPN
jgi:preprotein translocase subunit SecG